MTHWPYTPTDPMVHTVSSDREPPRLRALTPALAGGSLEGVPRPCPAQTVRDLIVIARLLYRTWRAANRNDARLPELVASGRTCGRR